MYLLILDYQSDAERKRVDYAVERWQSKLKIKKPKGTVIIVDGTKNTIDEFVEDLSARLEKSENKISIYEIEKYSPEIKINVKRLSYQTTEQRDFVEKFIEYLMTKLSASYEYNSDFGKMYKISTKKGQVKLDIATKGKSTGTDIKIGVEGYGEVVDFILEKIDNEMRIFLGSG